MRFQKKKQNFNDFLLTRITLEVLNTTLTHEELLKHWTSFNIGGHTAFKQYLYLSNDLSLCPLKRIKGEDFFGLNFGPYVINL